MTALTEALRTAVISDPTKHIDTLIEYVVQEALKEEGKDEDKWSALTLQIHSLKQQNQDLKNHNDKLQNLNERFKQEIDRYSNFISKQIPIDNKWTDDTTLSQMINAMAKIYGRTSIIPTIKLVRAITNTGLKEAKDRVEPHFDAICPKPGIDGAI